jgi:FkbM family methyltransferase
MSKTKAGSYVRSSHGNWQYPAINVGWGLSKAFAPRRTVHCDGVSFSLSCINPITHFRWYLFPRKESEVREYINQYVKDGDVFFDIGANVGVFSLYCAKRFPKTKVFSFEPEHSNLGLLKDNVIANRLGQRITITSVAVSDFSGLSFLNIQDTAPGAAAHTEHKGPLTTTDEGYAVVWKEGIATATVDDLVKHLGVVPNTMKIDTDGNEDKIFRGATKTLANPTLRSMILEMPSEEPKNQFCTTVLKNNGFVLKWSRPDTKNEVWVRQ